MSTAQSILIRFVSCNIALVYCIIFSLPSQVEGISFWFVVVVVQKDLIQGYFKVGLDWLDLSRLVKTCLDLSRFWSPRIYQTLKNCLVQSPSLVHSRPLSSTLVNSRPVLWNIRNLCIANYFSKTLDGVPSHVHLLYRAKGKTQPQGVVQSSSTKKSIHRYPL
jgi:hypothetical protein